MDISRLEAAAEGISERLAMIDGRLTSLNHDMPDYVVGIMAAILEASNPIENKDQVPPRVYVRRARDLLMSSVAMNQEIDSGEAKIVAGWHRPRTPQETQEAREREARGEDL